MDKSFSPRDRIQELLEYIKNFKYQDSFIRVGTKPRPNMSPFEKIQYTSQAFLTGALPNSETLEYIAISFNKYISAKGKLSLDEAFGLRSTPAQGNPAKKYDRDNELNGILFDMAYARAQNKMTSKRVSLEKVAGAVTSPECKYTIDSLVKYYKKNRWDNVRDIMIRQGHIVSGNLIF